MENRSFFGKVGSTLMRLLIVILLIILVGAGVWLYQQSKIDKLNAQIKEQDEQIVELKKNGSLSESITSRFDSIASKARDTERQSDINALQGQIEAYYAEFGRYPTLRDVNVASWRSTNLNGLDDGALRDPQGTKSLLDPKPGTGVYSYDVTTLDRNTCNNATKDCMLYKLTATLEDGRTFTKQNLN
jgi:type II secretory pathway pseudopilin PulG